MTSSTFKKLLLLALLLSLLVWLLNRGTSDNLETPESLPTSPPLTERTPSSETTGFTVTSSRPLPRAGNPPSQEVMTAAREHLQQGGSEGKCGPYTLLGDVIDVGLLAACERIGAQLDDTYKERFGVDPVGQPAATILLFDNRDGYRGFAAQEGMTTAGYAGFSVPSRGYIAAWADADRSEDFAKTLAHEMTHLVNRRALGGSLPRWLSEGLADAVGDTATGSGFQALDGLRGVEGQASRLLLGLESGQVRSTARLVSLDNADFDAAVISYDYEQSALLVRYLLVEPDLADRFRAFLARLAEGEDYSPELLQQHLAVEWTEFDRRLTSWVRSATA